MKASERDTNMELLRLVLMFFIVIHHSIVHGLGLMELSHSFCTLSEPAFIFACLINAFCIIAVNAFILISGYFSIQCSKSKFIYLMAQLAVCVLLFSIPYFAATGAFRQVLSNLLLFSHSRYWFIIDYFILFAFAPALNLLFDNTSKNGQLLFIASLFFVSCYLGFVWHHDANINGYTIFQFIFLYSIGRFIKINDFSFKSAPATLIYVLCSVLVASLMIAFHHTGHDLRAWSMTFYNNPVLVVSAISFFFIFRNLQFQSSRINYLASSSIIIYLFTCSALVEGIYYPLVQRQFMSVGLGVFPIILFEALLLASTSILLDKLMVSRLVSLLHRNLMSIDFSQVKQ